MHHQPARQGTALITSSVLIVTLTFMAASMTSLSVAGLRSQDDRTEKVELVMSCETGLNAAMAFLQINYDTLVDDDAGTDLDLDVIGDIYALDLNSLAVGDFDPSSLNGISNTATIERIGASPTNDTADSAIFLIQITAAQGSASDATHYKRMRLEATFAPTTSESFNQAMFAIQGYDFQGSATTDSWDSSAGTFGSGAGNGNEGDLASEGTISVQKPGNVSGTVFSNQELTLPSFNYESELAAAGTTTLINPSGSDPGPLNDSYLGTFPSSKLTLTAANSPYRCSQMLLTGSGNLEIDGNVELFVDGPINVQGNKTTQFITYLANSSLRIYQDDYSGTDETSWDNNGGILGDATELAGSTNNDPKYEAYPQNLIIMTEYTGEFKMNGNGVFSGVFFAPQSTIKFNGTFNFFGSVIAQRFDSKSGSTDDPGKVNGTFNFHYDENLSNLDLDLNARLVMLSWRSYDLAYHN